MQQTKQIASRFQEVFLNGKWIANTNFSEQLSDITWQEATTQINSLNTIGKLTFHINYYVAGLIDFFQKGELTIKDSYSFDIHTIASEKEWKELVNSLIDNAKKFTALVEQMPDEKLNAIFFDSKYGTCQRNIDRLIEHAYYHLAQITLIKKLIRR